MAPKAGFHSDAIEDHLWFLKESFPEQFLKKNTTIISVKNILPPL